MREGERLEDLGVNERIKLKWVSRSGVGVSTGFIWPGIGINVGLYD
jgi:hypothetical protein